MFELNPKYQCDMMLRSQQLNISITLITGNLEYALQRESAETDRSIKHQPKLTVILFGDMYLRVPPLATHISCIHYCVCQ